MSLNKIILGVSDSSFQPNRVLSYDEGEISGENVNIANIVRSHLPAENETDSSQPSRLKALRGKVVSISSSLRSKFCTVQIVNFFLEVFGLVIKCVKFTNDRMVSEVIPYLTCAAIPFSLALAGRRTYIRLKFLVAALRAHDFVNAVFFLSQAVDMIGTLLGSISKTFAGGAKFLGIGENPALTLIFKSVVPIIMIVVGALGMVVDTWFLGKNLWALKKFHKADKGYDKKVDRLLATLDYLKGPKSTASRLNADGTYKKDGEYKSEFHQSQVDKWIFKENHSTNDKRFKDFQTKISKFLERQNLQDASDILTDINAEIKTLKDAAGDEIHPLLQELFAISDHMDELSQGQELALIFRLTSLFGELSSYIEENESLTPEDKAQLQTLVSGHLEGLQTLEKDLHEGLLLVGIAKGELHRKIVYRIISIFVSAMVLTSGILFLMGPHQYMLPAQIISIASSGINILRFLFDRSIYQENMGRIEEFLASLRREKLLIPQQA
jgi:hypothetical protein